MVQGRQSPTETCEYCGRDLPDSEICGHCGFDNHKLKISGHACVRIRKEIEREKIERGD